MLGAFLGSLISFVLFAAWDEWKDSKLNKFERARVLSLLAIESAENIIRAEQIKRVLLRESAKISIDRRSYIESPNRLSSDSWTIAKAGNPLKHMQESDLMKWILAYSNLTTVNGNLEARELSKATSRGMAIRSELIKRYDTSISRLIDRYLQRVKEALDSLPNDVRVQTSEQERLHRTEFLTGHLSGGA
jgi:hypothetical protein